MTTYEPVIGLEVHAELMTASKMFCGCRVVDSVEAAPNTAVCPVCLGMPGMLPVINKRAVEYALRVALALNCTVQSHNVFARKNYFYPDLPKAYQISQYELPLAINGWLDLALNGESRMTKRVRIRRVHLEEDTGKLTHLEGEPSQDGKGQNGSHVNGPSSLVDYNRSGVPLLEIVSEPDMFSIEEARHYALNIRQILRYLGVNSGDMEKGVIRFEANISLRPAGASTLGTRTEIKNLNSFRTLTDAIGYEIDRQTDILSAGGDVIQDTVGWSETRRQTFSQRGKEEAHDYRYFPEPDLPPLQIPTSWVKEIRATLPELPDAKAARFEHDLKLTSYEAGILVDDRLVAEWFEEAVNEGGDPKAVANWMINMLFALMNEHRQGIDDIVVTPARLVQLIGLVDAGEINHNTAKDVLGEMFATGKPAPEIVAAKGLAQITDERLIDETIARILANNPDQVSAYRSGKVQLRGWFMGQTMRALKGKADPQLVNRLLALHLARLENDI